jgi:hypothetical protein
MAPPPLPLDSPQLPLPPPMLALVLGDIGAEHSPSAFMMHQVRRAYKPTQQTACTNSIDEGVLRSYVVCTTKQILRQAG